MLPRSTNTKMGFMSGASNTCINGGTVLQVGGHVLAPINISNTTDTTDKGIEALCARVASGAFFNSSERGDPPTCYPETRTAILRKIMDWLNHCDTDSIHADQLLSTSPEDSESEIDFDPDHPAMWLHGPAGSGKTAIAQRIAEMCHENGCLSAAFFFSRSGISSETFLVSTLAYEISKYIPNVRPFISAAILKDPFIFNLSMESQINSLIIAPLKQVTITTSVAPRLIIIDGLDECLSRDAQSNIIHSFTAALTRFPEYIPHKLLIASRPEHQLYAAFSEQHISRLPLRETMQAYDDVRYFIQKSLAEVKEKHYLRNRIPDLWPSDEDVTILVSKSSGHFIYASTVVKYVTSARHNPAERLNVILGLSVDINNKPYADLDALYTHILSKIVDVETVRLIFRIVLAKTLSRPGSPSVFTFLAGDHFKAAEYLLGLPEGKGELKLLDLFEVLISATKPPEPRKIKFLHASFTDYLVDPSRSGKFCINDENLCLTLVKECMALVTAKRNLNDAADHSHQLRLCYDMLVHFMESVPRNSHLCPQLYKLLSQMDWNTALSQMTSMQHNCNPEVLGSLTRFISWVVERYTSISSDNANILEDFISNLRNWFVAQLKMFHFNGPDNSARVDLTVFAMVPLLYERDANILHPLKDIFRNVDWNGNLIQASFTPDVVLCWRMMQKLPCFFENENLAKVYTMTEKRYTNAARYCLSYMLPETSSWTKWKQSRSPLYPSEESYERATECLAFMLPKCAPHFQLFSICTESMKNAVGSDYDAINEHILQGNVDPLTTLVDVHLDREMQKANILSTAKPLLLSWEIARYLVRCGQNHDILNPPISQNWLFMRAIPTSQTLARRHAKHKKSTGYN